MQKRLAFRKKELIHACCFSTTAFWAQSPKNTISDGVLFESSVLKRFFSCTDGLVDLFRSAADGAPLDDKSLLCEHRGVKPRTVSKLKLLSTEMYDILLRVLNAEYKMYVNDGRTPDMISSDIVCKLDLKAGKDMICESCSTSHQFDLREKFVMTEVSPFHIDALFAYLLHILTKN